MKKTVSFFILISISSFLFSLEVPNLIGHINDYANIMTSYDKQESEKYLSSLEDTTGIQIAVLTIDSLQGEDLETYSNKVAETWLLGQKDKDNGALLLIAKNERKIRIETGYGLEEKLTDMKSGLIIRNVILPDFRNGNYSEGIVRGIKNMGGIVSDNATLVSKSVSSPNESNGTEGVLFGLLFVFGWFILFSCLASGRRNHWLPWLIFSSSFRNQYNSSYKNHSNSSSFRNNGFNHSSGFHGGGGHFGGGGASGGW